MLRGRGLLLWGRGVSLIEGGTGLGWGEGEGDARSGVCSWTISMVPTIAGTLQLGLVSVCLDR